MLNVEGVKCFHANKTKSVTILHQNTIAVFQGVIHIHDIHRYSIVLQFSSLMSPEAHTYFDTVSRSLVVL